MGGEGWREGGRERGPEDPGEGREDRSPQRTGERERGLEDPAEEGREGDRTGGPKGRVGGRDVSWTQRREGAVTRGPNGGREGGRQDRRPQRKERRERGLGDPTEGGREGMGSLIAVGSLMKFWGPEGPPFKKLKNRSAATFR